MATSFAFLEGLACGRLPINSSAFYRVWGLLLSCPGIGIARALLPTLHDVRARHSFGRSSFRFTCMSFSCPSGGVQALVEFCRGCFFPDQVLNGGRRHDTDTRRVCRSWWGGRRPRRRVLQSKCSVREPSLDKLTLVDRNCVPRRLPHLVQSCLQAVQNFCLLLPGTFEEGKGEQQQSVQIQRDERASIHAASFCYRVATGKLFVSFRCCAHQRIPR